MIIGAQLYTVRDACTNLNDFSNTLARVADMGYTAVQISGTCAFEGEWLAEQLKKNDLTADITHVELADVTDNTDATVEKHKKFNCKYIGLGSMPSKFRGSIENAVEFCNVITPAATRMKESGAYLMYHNHAFEYETKNDATTVMHTLSDMVPADIMGFTLDTYWVKYGGYDPVEEIKRLGNRIPCVHFKDMEVLEDGERRYCPVGSGVLDFEKIIAALEDTVCEYAFVEQDLWFGRDPFDCLKMSYDYLNSLGLK